MYCDQENNTRDFYMKKYNPKNVNNNKCAPKLIFLNTKKNQKDSGGFCHRKFSLTVRFWHFLTTMSIDKIRTIISLEYVEFWLKILLP